MTGEGRDLEDAVSRIVEAVRAGGDAALRRLTRRFDGASRRSIEVGAAERRAGAGAVDADVRRALRLAAARIASFARGQKASLRPFRVAANGIVLEQRLLPIERVGVYAPGGRHPLCSSVLMGALPARIAGCREVILCTPPRRDGSVAPEILAAAEEAGIDRVFAVGGAQAIAAMAWGTRTVPAVDLIVGPGNRYVAAAKSLVAAHVGIDFTAGPSELLVIADRTADVEAVAADLVAQAEHDPDARLLLVRVGRNAAPGVEARIAVLMARDLPDGSPGRAAARASLARLRVFERATIAGACLLSDRLAPEHLSLQVASPRRVVPRLRSYGSLFIGRRSAVALGDYVTGPNHVLPTGGAARHAGGLSVLRFLKVVTVQEAGEGIARLADAARTLARVEGLHAHAASVALRVAGTGPEAVLFDFNGVLMDDEEFHFRACRQVMAGLGIALTRTRYDDRYLAFDDRNALRAMLADGRRPVNDLDRLVRRKRALFRRLIASRVRIERPVIDLVRSLAARVPIAIVSGAARSEIMEALRQAGLVGFFRAIIASEDVSRCKPDPEGYRLGLRRLGLRSGARALAIEDSPGGIRAARRAGLRVLGVATSYAPAALRRAGAFRVVPILAALRPDEVLDPPMVSDPRMAPGASVRPTGRRRGPAPTRRPARRRSGRRRSYV